MPGHRPAEFEYVQRRQPFATQEGGEDHITLAHTVAFSSCSTRCRLMPYFLAMADRGIPDWRIERIVARLSRHFSSFLAYGCMGTIWHSPG